MHLGGLAMGLTKYKLGELIVPREEATVSPSSTNMAALANDVMRLWAAFSSLIFSRLVFSSLRMIRMAKIPMIRITTAWQKSRNS